MVEKLDNAQQDRNGCSQGPNPGQDKGTLLVTTLAPPPPFFLTRSGNLEMFLGVSSLFKAWLEQGTRALPSSGSRHMSRLFE